MMMTKLHVRVFFLGSNWKIVIINSTLTDDNDNDTHTHTRFDRDDDDDN